VYVADLSRKNPDGTYPVKVISRSAWDEKGASRRKARREALAPPSQSAPPGASGSGAPAASAAIPTGKVVAIIYGADWCKPCHDAARYLKQRGVLVVEKNVEEDAAAQQEMRKKLERAKLPGASIPVIDVMGQVLVGFSPRALERAIEQAQNAQTL